MTTPYIRKRRIEISEKNQLILFTLFLFIYQLLFIFQGLDLSDEGFLVVFYQQIFANPESVQYNFMFWLTGVFGGLWMKLFPGFFAFRLGGILITTLTAIIVHENLKNFIHKDILKISLFLIILAMNNDVKGLSYNNISALFYVTAIFILVNGLTRNNLKLLALSGFISGLNTFNRLPNILSIGLLIVIFYCFLIQNKNLKLLLLHSGIFISGFAISFLFAIGLMHYLGHLDIFTNAVKLVYQMSQGDPSLKLEESNYGLMKLIKQFLSNNIKAINTALSIIVVSFCLNYFIQVASNFRKLSKLISHILGILLAFICTILIVKDPNNKYFLIFLYTGLSLLSLPLLFEKTISVELKLLLVAGIYFMFSFPMGSSAAIYTAGRYCLWIAFPISLHFFLTSLSRKFEMKYSKNILFYNSLTDIFSVFRNLNIKLILPFLIMVSIYFAYYYPFFDNSDRLGMSSRIENKKMKGIFVTKEKADLLNELLVESTKFIKPGDSVIAYDCMPLYHYMTETVPYMHSAYPWLYEPAAFKTDLDLSYKNNKNCPVVIVQKMKTIGYEIIWPVKNPSEDYLKWERNKGRNTIMNEFLSKNKYRIVWSNDFFNIMIPENYKQKDFEHNNLIY